MSKGNEGPHLFCNCARLCPLSAFVLDVLAPGRLILHLEQLALDNGIDLAPRQEMSADSDSAWAKPCILQYGI